jgi:hypothetical protein
LDPQTERLAAAFEDKDDEIERRDQIAGMGTSGPGTPAYEENTTVVAVAMQEEGVEVTIHPQTLSKASGHSNDHHGPIAYTNNDLLSALKDAAEGAHLQGMLFTEDKYCSN